MAAAVDTKSTFDVPVDGAGEPPPSSSIKDIFGRIKKGFEMLYANTKIAKDSLKITAKAIPANAVKIGRVVSGLGILAGVNVLMTLYEIPGTVSSIQKSAALQDYRNAILQGISLTINPLSAFDEVIAFSGAVCKLAALPAVGAFTVAAIPVALSLLSVTTLTTSYRIGEDAMMLHRTKDTDAFLKQYMADNHDLKIFIPTTADENHLSERIGKNLFKQVVQLKSYQQDKASISLKSSVTDPASEVMKSIRKRTVRQICLNVASVLTKLITIIAICLLFTPLSPFAALSLFLVASLMKVGNMVYKEYFLERGLESPFAA